MREQATAVRLKLTKLKNLKTGFKKHLKLVVITTSLLVLVLLIILIIPNISAQSANIQKSSIDAKKTYDLNKEYSFPLKDTNNIEVGKIKYTIENAQLVDEIVIKGQRATAIEGKTFLIINLKVINNLSQPIQINIRDYIRIVVDENEKDLIAPDIHNDPVEIQPISTKFTRIGIPIDDNFKKIQLKVGEINGDKTTLDINF